MQEMCSGIKKGVRADATFTYIDSAAVEKSATQFPIWVPPARATQGFHTRSGKKAFDAGLTSLSIEDSAKATNDWLGTLPKAEQKSFRARSQKKPRRNGWPRLSSELAP